MWWGWEVSMDDASPHLMWDMWWGWEVGGASMDLCRRTLETALLITRLVSVQGYLAHDKTPLGTP